MAEITLAASSGRTTGTRPSRRLRAQGRIPATVYGLGQEAVSVSVDWRDLRHALTTDAGFNAVLDLVVDGGEPQLAIVKHLQRHPVRRDVLHIDLLRVSRDIAITVDVPIVLHGEAEQVLRDGGLVNQVLNQLSITAKPADIPNEIGVDVTGLTVGDAVRVGDLQLPPGVETSVDAEEPVVTAQAAQAAELPEEAAEAAEGEAEAAEGEAPAAGDEGGGEGDTPAESSE